MTRSRPIQGLSALVVAHNEEARLDACLATLGFAAEIVVVLDRTTDGSKAIAERHGAKVMEGAWPIEGDRRNEGIAACVGPWIFEMDCDEHAAPDLGPEIAALLASPAHDYFLIPVDNYVGARLVKYGWGAQFGKNSYPGLFKKGVKTWGLDSVHPKLTFSPGATKGPRLQAGIAHYVDRNISDMIRRFDNYTSARARDIRMGRAQAGSAARNYRRIVTRFWRCFVGKKGYKEGGLGFLIAIFAALYPLVSYLKAKYESE